MRQDARHAEFLAAIAIAVVRCALGACPDLLAVEGRAAIAIAVVRCALGGDRCGTLAPLSHQLFDVWPRLAASVPIASLGEFPTKVEPLGGLESALRVSGGSLYVKRDDLSSAVYGGNKVRTLEVLFGSARQRGVTHVFSTGAYGSNHSVATVLHAPRAGLVGGAVLFPQPVSEGALENLRVTLAASERFVALPHWSALPFGMLWTARTERRRGHRAALMVPGGATPLGALGYVGAAFELARQVDRGELPRPARIVVGVGSTCTSAGLLCGLTLAARLGIGFVEKGAAAPPELVSVRVSPWPVTSRHRIVGLAVRTSALLARLAGEPSLALGRDAIGGALTVDGRFLGPGYGHATPEGRDALRAFHAAGGPELDTTYSAKAAAAFLSLARSGARGPSLYWATKSTAPLPETTMPDDAPRAVRHWIERAERALSGRAQPYQL